MQTGKGSASALESVPFLTKNPFKQPPMLMWMNFHTVSHIPRVWLYWGIVSQRVPMAVFWCCQLLRVPILLDLSGYFAAKERQPNVDVSTVASFKFVLLIFLSAHYIGTISYFLCILAKFDTADESMSWVIQYHINNFVKVDIGEVLSPANYLLAMFKGISFLTPLSYENTVPRRMADLLFAITAFMIQMVVKAYILGEW